jgi:hypothetical protein
MLAGNGNEFPFPLLVSRNDETETCFHFHVHLPPITETRTSLIPISARDFYSYSILRTIVLVPLTPLPPKLLRILMSTMAAGRFATLTLPTVRRHPNRVHRRHPHTMGDAACAWFGRSPLWG